MDLVEESTLFGRLALGNRFLTQEQLDDVIDTQGRLQVHRRLGDIAVAKGYLSPPQLRQILDLQERLAAIKSKAGGVDPALEGPRAPAAIQSDTKYILHPRPPGAPPAAAPPESAPRPAPACAGRPPARAGTARGGSSSTCAPRPRP